MTDRAAAIAAAIADQISQGTYPTGTQLPSHAALCETYGATRPTIQEALRLLHHQHLITSSQGIGTFVARTAPPTINRTPSPHREPTHPIEPPVITRVTLADIEAALLDLDPGTPAFAVSRLVMDVETRVRALHRILLPYPTAAAHDDAALTTPSTSPAELYTALARHHRRLTWWETITTRTATPDEAIALQIPRRSGHVLITTRTTRGRRDTPLLLEHTTSSATAATIAYRLTSAPTTARTKTT
ncbi:GntR family transcriptional regulator [Streptomyces sp. MS19]|uniref:GntR family transcriptional regulator n=1 Tax=Streptomyces sp. MS19 TaxID=3385972 RepID=UPI00399F57E2